MGAQIHLNTDGGVATITLDRPEARNALGGTMREDLLRAIESVAADLKTRVLVITGAGREFCTGGDVDCLAELKARNAPFREVANLMEMGRRVVMALRNLDRPVIAAVNGAAFGAGLSLALACDIRIASDTATFACALCRLGLHPHWGGTYFLPRLVGTSRALRLVWTGEVIGADEALRIGLIDEVVPADRHTEAVRDLAGKLATASPVALEWSKRVIYQSGASDLLTMIRLEKEAQQACWESSDSGEGIAALKEKRPARFHGES